MFTARASLPFVSSLIVVTLGVFFTSIGQCARSVSLEWDANSETNIAGYKAYCGPSSRTYTNVINVGNLISTRVSGLIEGTTYYFAVTAYTTDGVESDYSDEVSYTVPSNVQNRAPTLGALADLTISEDSGSRIISLSGISSGAAEEIQTLVITAASSNPSLIPHPTVNYTSPNATGSLSFSPAPGGSGSATISVTVNDGQAISNSITRSLTVTVNAANDPPTLNVLTNLIVNEGMSQTISLAGVSSGAANEAQTLSISAVSSNPNLVPHPTINYTSPNTTGTLQLRPVTGIGGNANIIVTVSDGQASGGTLSRAFTVTVNRLPSISAITNRFALANVSTGPIAFSVSDPETAALSLVVSATSSDTAVLPVANIAFAGSGSNRTVTMTPVSGMAGASDVTISVSDGTGSKSTTFRVTFRAKPSAPTSLKLAGN